MARPPAYTRNYSFSDYETNNPGQPKPGVQLDTEYDNVSNALTATQDALALIQRDDGQLANECVGIDQLQSGVFDGIADPIIEAAEDAAERAENAAAASANSASVASNAALTASNNAQLAAGSASQAGISQSIAQSAASDAEQSAQEAAQSATDAAQSANDAAGAVAESQLNEETSYRWAEYLAAPVAPAPAGYPEAVDDGMWSAKWWALKARDLVGQFGSMYLGTSGTPPLTGNAGQPLAPGMFFYLYPPGILLMWDGTRWEPFTTPTPAIATTYVYQATPGQTVFSGLDLFGALLIWDQDFPEPTDVHVNGVRLVNSRGTGFGDFSVDTAAGTVTILDPAGLIAGSVVQIDLLLPKERLVPITATVAIQKLQDLSSAFDGVDVDFDIRNITDGNSIVVATPMEIFVSLDGVPQEPAVDFTVSGSTVIFAQPPPAGTRFWGVRYQP